jgi:hypothetical protein
MQSKYSQLSKRALIREYAKVDERNFYYEKVIFVVAVQLYLKDPENELFEGEVFSENMKKKIKVAAEKERQKEPEKSEEENV